MSSHLRVFFHFRSPYSRLGLHLLDKAAIEHVIPTTFHILTKAAGTDEPIDPGSTKPRRRYLMQDVPRMTTHHGLALNYPRPFDPDYRPSYAAFYAARAKGKGFAFALALSHARWGDGRDISDPEVLRSALEAADVDPDQTPMPDPKPLLAEDTALLEEYGAFGVPFGVIDKGDGEDGGDKELFFGHDRFALLIDRARAVAAG